MLENDPRLHRLSVCENKALQVQPSCFSNEAVTGGGYAFTPLGVGMEIITNYKS
jgi:hypothetical protein